jgi:hypothetical protein
MGNMSIEQGSREQFRVFVFLLLLWLSLIYICYNIVGQSVKPLLLGSYIILSSSSDAIGQDFISPLLHTSLCSFFSSWLLAI